MTKNTILVIDNDQATSKWLFTFLSNAGYEVRTASSGREGLGKLTAERPNLVILDLSLPDIGGEQVVESIIQNPITANIPIVVLLRKDNPQEIARLFDKGIADYIVKRPGIESELLAKCRTCLSRARHSTSQLPKGRLISFFSAKGGNGTSTLCLNLAHILARQVTPKTVLVTDMVLPLGSLSIMTGSQQRRSIVELTTEGGPYDYKKLKEFLAPARLWDFSILQGSRNPHDAQRLNPDQIEPLFESLLLMFNYVIVDLGKTLSRVSLPLLGSSDGVVIVLGVDLVTVELTLAALKFLEETGIQKDKLFLILNRAVGREGLSKLEIERRFNLPIQGTVPYVQDNFNLASNQNVPYASRFPQDPCKLILNDLAGLLRKRITDIHEVRS
ncbi:MAG: response regulator [Anaerolineales bacterium]|nr:response regulator [Anaerolineales bacterium]